MNKLVLKTTSKRGCGQNRLVARGQCSEQTRAKDTDKQNQVPYVAVVRTDTVYLLEVSEVDKLQSPLFGPGPGSA